MNKAVLSSGISWNFKKGISQELQQFLSDPQFCAQFARAAKPLKVGKLKSVFSISLKNRAFPELILKKRRHFSLKGQWKMLSQGSRLATEFRNYLEAERRGISVPRAMAVGHKRCFGLLREAYLLLEFIGKSRTLKEIWLEETRVGESQMDRRFLRRLAAFVADLLKKGILHNDFSANNILVHGNCAGADFYLIDLDPCQIQNEPTAEDQQICLSQLALHLMQLEPRSEGEIARFLLEVLKQLGTSVAERKKWFRSVVEKAVSRYQERNLPKADKRLPGAGQPMSKDQRARRLRNRSIPIRLDFARPEGYVGAETFLPKTGRARTGFLCETAQALRAAHWHGIRANRVTLSNLIVRLDPNRGVELAFLNPEEFDESVGARHALPLTFEERIGDLLSCWKAARKGLARWRRADRIRFLKYYLGPWYSRQARLRPTLHALKVAL